MQVYVISGEEECEIDKEEHRAEACGNADQLKPFCWLRRKMNLGGCDRL